MIVKIMRSRGQMEISLTATLCCASIGETPWDDCLAQLWEQFPKVKVQSKQCKSSLLNEIFGVTFKVFSPGEIQFEIETDTVRGTATLASMHVIVLYALRPSAYMMTFLPAFCVVCRGQSVCSLWATHEASRNVSAFTLSPRQ